MTAGTAASPHATLRREMRLRDLVLFQVLYVLGPIGIGPAAMLGGSYAIFWLAAIFLFLVPQAILVVHLSRRWPLEGGLYQWVKLGISERVGFLAAWNLWLSNITIGSYAAVTIINHVVYALGPDARWMTESKLLNGGCSALLLGVIGLLAVRGLQVSKWVHNAGATSLLFCYALLLVLPWAGVATQAIPNFTPMPLVMPVFNLVSLNILAKMTVPALTGLDSAAVLAGECHNPDRDLGRATGIAAPLTGLLFVLGTGAVASFVPPNQIDLAAPFPQAIAAAAAKLGITIPVVAFVCAGLALYWFSGASCAFSAVTRLPLVAGWDYLLPRWFTRLHPLWRTPVNSILFTVGLSLAITLYSLQGAGHQEVFQLLINQTNVFSALAYLAMFALPFRMPASSRGLKLAGTAGLASTGLYVVLALFPLVEVRSATLFALKLGGLIVATNVGGIALFEIGSYRKAHAAVRQV